MKNILRTGVDKFIFRARIRPTTQQEKFNRREQVLVGPHFQRDRGWCERSVEPKEKIIPEKQAERPWASKCDGVEPRYRRAALLDAEKCRIAGSGKKVVPRLLFDRPFQMLEMGDFLLPFFIEVKMLWSVPTHGSRKTSEEEVL